jgi:DNA-directed RNA polymerase specialized sigma24 family protein
MRLFKPNRSRQTSPEAIFAEKYDWLLQWALHFARGNQAQAEDLVQDTFVRFVVSGPELTDPEHIEPLLYTYLKYVHLSHVRRTQRYPHQELALVDFDSIHIAIREKSSADPIELQNTLHQIVAYLLWRKEKAKSASILLLRFLHGYRRDEIMRIALVSDQMVANGLMLAREETRKYLDGHRQQSHAASESTPPILFPKCVAVQYDRFQAEIRRSIFAACNSTCLPSEQLLSLYQGANPRPIECKLLAHIVSCERCLDLVSKQHDMPPLSGRSPEEMAGSTRRTKLGLRASENGPRRVLRNAQQRLWELYDHQPRQLMVAVNGHIIASRDISSAISKLEVEVGRGTRMEFIEIVSEQGVCLLGVPVNSTPPEAPPEIRYSAELMHGRSVEIVLRFTSAGSLVNICYCDPVPPQSTVAAEEELDDLATHVDPEHAQPLQRPMKEFASRRFGGLIEFVCSTRSFRFPVMNSLLATALVLAIGSALCVVLWMKQRPVNITANALLVKAEACDSSIVPSGRRGLVLQRVRLKTPKGNFEHTLYRDAQGVRVPKPPALSSGEEQWTAKLAVAHLRWEDPLSPGAYQDWRNGQRTGRDEVTSTGKNLLTLKTTVADGEVAWETITVREPDFHAVERTVQFRGSDTVEVAELDYHVLPWDASFEDRFEPLHKRTATDAPGILPASPVRATRRVSDLQLDEADVATRIALNQLQADTGERIRLVRGASNIEVKGVVDTDTRKQQIIDRLAQLSHVQVSILSVEELDGLPRSSSVFNAGQPIYVESVEAQASPLEQYLRETKLPIDRLASLSQSLLDGGLRIHQAEVHFSELQPRVNTAGHLPADLLSRATDLSRTYLNTIEAGLQANDRTLLSLGLEAASQASPLTESTPAEGDLEEQVRHYLEVCLELIGNGTAQSRPAAGIAEDLIHQSTRIRLHLADIRATIPPNPDSPAKSEIKE